MTADKHRKSHIEGFLPSPLSKEDLEKKSKEELIEIILNKNDIQIPLSVFLNEAGPLECIVSYLKEDKGFSVKEISKRLNRNIQTIWTTYRNSKKRKIVYGESEIKIPLRIFSKTDNSVLESLVFYLKESLNLRFCDIAKLLERDNRVIWKHYHRYTIKKTYSIGGKKNEKNIG